MKIVFALSVILMLTCLTPACGRDSTHGGPGDPTTGSNTANSHLSVVQKLENLIATNTTFREEMEDALKAQTESSFWYGLTLEDLVDFFGDWLVFLPRPDNARKYMDAFYDFADSAKGKEVAYKEPFKGWLYEFMVARGEFMDSEGSAAALPWWLSEPEVNMQDYVVPSGGYRSFNEFFTRGIKPGVRPIDASGDTSVLTSPADSAVLKLADELTSDTRFEVKGDSLSIRELLGGDERADKFINGTAVLFMLSTTNYHRFHSPVQGKIVAEQQLAGLYYGMTGGWVEYFFEHRRGYFILETEDFGYVAMVCVGMFTISSISFAATEGQCVNKGDELGSFAYGGSAIILLFEPNRVTFSIPFDRGPVDVLIGQRIGTATGQRSVVSIVAP